MALWLANDHLFKPWQASHGLSDPALVGLLSGIIGKLSDVSALWALPPALAALLLPSRRESLAWVFYAGVGLYFSLLQLSPAVIAYSETVLAHLGIPSTITADPSDLIALLSLGFAWRYFEQLPRCPKTAPASPESSLSPCTRPQPRTKLRRPQRPTPLHLALHTVGSVIVLLACVATSRRFDLESDPHREGRVFLYNKSGQNLSLRYALLKPNVTLDCFEVANTPPGYLGHDVLFGEELSFELADQQIQNLEALASSSAQNADKAQTNKCFALRIWHQPAMQNKDSAQPNKRTLLFWSNDELAPQSVVDDNLKIVEDIDQRSGVISILAPEDPQKSGDIRFTYPKSGLLYLEKSGGNTDTDVGAECTLTLWESRLAWSEDFPKTPLQLRNIGLTPRGCLELQLQPPDSAPAPIRRELCIPQQHPRQYFPFVSGQNLQFRYLRGESAATPGEKTSGLSISALEGASGMTTVTMSRGATPAPIEGLQVALRKKNDCPATMLDPCGSQARAMEVYARVLSTSDDKDKDEDEDKDKNEDKDKDKEKEKDKDKSELLLSSSKGQVSAGVLEINDERSVELALFSAQEFPVHNADCATAPGQSGPYLEMIAIERRKSSPSSDRPSSSGSAEFSTQ